MAYIDDLNAPRPRRQQPLFAGAQQPPTPDVNVTYGGQSPVGTNGAPNQDYSGNTGVVKPPPPVIPPPPSGGQQGAGGGGTTPPPATPPPPPPNQGTNVNYAQALDALYKKYFYRAPEAGEMSTHLANLTANRGTLQNIESELQREAARLQLTPPTTATADPFARTAQNNPGLDQNKWTAGHSSPKYAWHEIGQQHDLRTQAGRDAALAQAKAQYPQWFGSASWSGDDWLNLGSNGAGDWNGVTGFDAVLNASGEGGGTRPWMGNETFAAGYGPTAQGTGASGAAGGAGSSAAGAGGGSSAGGDGAAAPFPGLGGSGGFDFGVTGEYGYDDPSTRKLEEFLRLMIDEKVKPIDDPARNAYSQQMWDAINQLTNPALTENDRARLENRSLEPMERDRQIRLQQQKERMAAMGHGESSGTIVEALAGVDRDYDRRRGEVQRDLSIYEREQQDARRRESLSLGEALSNLSGQQRGEQDARMREALTYVSLFPEMDERRLRLAMETLGMSNGMANAPSIFNTLSNLQAQANLASQQGQQSNAQFWGQMGQWMANAWPKSGGA